MDLESEIHERDGLLLLLLYSIAAYYIYHDNHNKYDTNEKLSVLLEVLSLRHKNYLEKSRNKK